MSTFFYTIILLLWGRTLLWHLRQWQWQEYRWDRMRSWLDTDDGSRAICSAWFFRGLLPRPVFTARVGLIAGISLVLSIALVWTIDQWLPLGLSLLLGERLVWLTTAVGVGVSGIIRRRAEIQLFGGAKALREKSGTNLKIIGITGSYGKSSTKRILVHLLQHLYGEDRVLFLPGNNNTEVAIARFMEQHADFLTQKTEKERFFVVEMGAYTKGEIARVSDFVQPHTGVLTAIGTQHLSLFGSVEKLREAKSELAQAASERVIWRDHDPVHTVWVRETAPSWPGELTLVPEPKVTDFDLYHTSFTYQDASYVLPWGGAFYAHNAALCLEYLLGLGHTPKSLAEALKALGPQDVNLKPVTHAAGWVHIEDLYSANTDGVLAAIAVLGQQPGQKIFVGLPIRELTQEEAKKAHTRIFEALKGIGAKVWWYRTDFQDDAKRILGTDFQSDNTKALGEALQELTTGDGVLLESKLPTSVVELVRATSPTETA